MKITQKPNGGAFVAHVPLTWTWQDGVFLAHVPLTWRDLFAIKTGLERLPVEQKDPTLTKIVHAFDELESEMRQIENGV